MMSDVYQSTLAGAGLFDRSATAKLVLRGPDAPTFLHNLSTNDIKNLPLGGGCPVYFCDSRAKVQFQTVVFHVQLSDGEHAMWLETTAGRGADLAKYLDRYLISEQVEIADRTADFTQWHLAGPRVKAIIEKALGETLPDLQEYQHTDRTFGTVATVSLRRRDPLGMPGYDLVSLADHGEEVKAILLAAGATLASSDVYETLRIEAGTPVFGPDIDTNRFVMEISDALKSVSYAKGCFLGQEPIVMARDRAGHVNRSFLGVKVLEGGLLPVGTKLFREGQEVGHVTSSALSPRLGLPISLGYLRWKHQEPGMRLEAETPAGRQAVEVMEKLPSGV